MESSSSVGGSPWRSLWVVSEPLKNSVAHESGAPHFLQVLGSRLLFPNILLERWHWNSVFLVLVPPTFIIPLTNPFFTVHKREIHRRLESLYYRVPKGTPLGPAKHAALQDGGLPGAAHCCTICLWFPNCGTDTPSLYKHFYQCKALHGVGAKKKIKFEWIIMHEEKAKPE